MIPAIGWEQSEETINMTTPRKAIIALVAVIAAAAALGFTKPGHHVLNTLGIATAGCDGGGGCN